MVGVGFNPHLNESYLNMHIRNICNYYPNTHFINVPLLHDRHIIFNLYDDINYTIDCIDYNNKYLCLKRIKLQIKRNTKIYTKSEENTTNDDSQKNNKTDQETQTQDNYLFRK